MKNFLLNQNNDVILKIFSVEHIMIVIFTLLIVMLIINNKEKFIDINLKQQKIYRYVLVIILITNFIIRRGSFIYYDVYDWHNHLDINFCNFTSIMFLIYGITGSKKIYNICYYMAFIGPLLSIIIPSVNLSPLNYSFYSFFILHHMVFIFNIIFMFIEKKEYSKSDYKKSCIFLIIYFILVYIFDYFMKVNYNFPISFVNENIRKLSLYETLINIKYFDFLVMFLIIISLLLFARKILQIFNYKK